MRLPITISFIMLNRSYFSAKQWMEFQLCHTHALLSFFLSFLLSFSFGILARALMLIYFFSLRFFFLLGSVPKIIWIASHSVTGKSYPGI